MTTEKRPASGRAYAVAGLVLGGSASVAANVANAVYVQPTLNLVSVLSALFWPGATLIGFELIVRPAWPTTGWRSVPWWVMRLAVVGVGVVAVVGSYEHMHSLLSHFKEDPFVARFGPAAIDGLMVTSAAALLVIERFAAVPRSPRSIGRTLTAHPTRSIAWRAPTRSMPNPIEAIESTARSIEAIRSIAAATRSTPVRSTAIVPDPIDPPIDPPIDRPTPDRSRVVRPDMRSNDQSATGTTPRSGSPAPDRSAPDWVGRSTLAPGGGTRRSLDELLADLDAALAPAEPIPSANALRRHYGIGAPRDRELRDAITNVRQQRAAGGVEGDIGS